MKVATPCRKDIIVLGPYSFIDIDHNDTFDHDADGLMSLVVTYSSIVL